MGDGVVKIKVKPPVYRSGGGALEAALVAQGRAAAADVRALLLDAAQRIVDTTVDKAGPGVKRDGWPIGPPRPWEPGHVHSYTRFELIDRSRGWRVDVVIVNRAPYAQFIHAPGDKSHHVVTREIAAPMARALGRLRATVRDVINARLVGRG